MYSSDKRFKTEKGKKATSIIAVSFLLLFIFIQTGLLFSAQREAKIGAISMEGTGGGSTLVSKLEAVELLIAKGGELNLDIVVVPEFYFMGKTMTSGIQILSDSQVLDSMKVYAQQHNVNIVFNVVEYDKPNAHNTAVVVNRGGEYVGKYRKVNLPFAEKVLTPGDTFPVFELDFGKIGILICFDLWNSEPSRIMVENGAEVIIVPTWCNNINNLKTNNALTGLPFAFSVKIVDCGIGEGDIPSSVFNQYGDSVFVNHVVGGNHIAVGTVEIGSYTNLALNKSTTASAGTDPANPDSNAVDGIFSIYQDATPEMQTSWNASALPQWIEIDLGDEYDIDRVCIAQFNSDTYDYTVEGRTAAGAYEQLSNQFNKLETIIEAPLVGSEIASSIFDKKKVRFVKLTVNSTTQTDLTINEIKIYGYGDTTTVGITANDIIPGRFGLYQNYPNPFNPETTIRFALGERSRVRLTVYNMQGQVVKVLLNEMVPVGEYQTRWDGRDENGQLIPSGVYFSVIEIESNSGRRIVDHTKMLLIK